MVPPVNPTLLSIGPITVQWYGVLVVTGILLGANVAVYLAKDAGKNPEYVWDMLLAAVILGIIGARLEYVLVSPHWAYYKDHLAEIFYIWQGGLRIYGAIVGGAIGIAAYAAVQHLHPLQLLDFAAPGMAIGHAIGRWGNFINYELYGPPTTLPWGLHIPLFYRVPPYTNLALYPETTRFHPAFLYESLANLTLCLILIWIATRYRKQLKMGDITAGYLIGYSLIRFLMDFMRTDGTSAQVIALIALGIGVAFIVARHWLFKIPGVSEAQG